MKHIIAFALLYGGFCMAHNFKLESASFKHNGFIDSKYTCDGANISPELHWSGVPQHTKSFALIVDDPDAPGKVFVHWILFNIPSAVNSLAEDIKNAYTAGTNDFSKQAWGGPCPPSGVHHYHFKLYALDTTLSPQAGVNKDSLIDSMKGHILAQTELIGRYQRKK